MVSLELMRHNAFLINRKNLGIVIKERNGKM